jgi:hypothetical protein
MLFLPMPPPQTALPHTPHVDPSLPSLLTTLLLPSHILPLSSSPHYAVVLPLPPCHIPLFPTSYVDAVGIGPYFGDGINYDGSTRANGTLDGVFAALGPAVQGMRSTIREHAAVIITQYNKQVWWHSRPCAHLIEVHVHLHLHSWAFFFGHLVWVGGGGGGVLAGGTSVSFF